MPLNLTDQLPPIGLADVPDGGVISVDFRPQLLGGAVSHLHAGRHDVTLRREATVYLDSTGAAYAPEDLLRYADRVALVAMPCPPYLVALR